MPLHAPQARRPLSRSSVATTLTQQSSSSPPSSWSSGMPQSSATSSTSATEWSDQGTEMPNPQSRLGYKVEYEDWNDEPPLIDFDEPAEEVEVKVEKPADRLKMLLRQMEAEVEKTKHKQEAVRAMSPVKEMPREVRSNWRNGRRGMISSETHNGEPRVDIAENGHLVDGSDADVEEDSPPTPPLRITNPYLSRRPVEESSTSHRITSRAAVLRNSLTKSPENNSRTPLETFIATHDQISDPSSSRSHDRSFSSSTSSRKGKERAQETRFSHTPRRSHTPRKLSIELPPDNSALFAEEAASLEVRGDVLDISDISGEPPWEDDGEESEEESPPRGQSHSRTISRPSEGSRTINTSDRDSRFSRALKRNTPSPNVSKRDISEETSLPPLPEPSMEDEDEPIATVSSRQASLFRSPSKSRSFASEVRSFDRSMPNVVPALRRPSPNFKRFNPSDIVQPEPIHVGMVHTVTPVKSNPITPVQATPHPPGRWYTPSKPAVRSPLAKTDDTTEAEEGNISIHRLRISPGKKASPNRLAQKQSPLKPLPPIPDEPSPEDADSSFLERIPGLSRMIAKSYPLPQPSSTIIEAKEALAQAAKTSTAAREQVEKTQRQFLEALASAQVVRDTAITAVKQGWTWGNWAWWVGVELLLLWAVFRVTLDYATSAHHLASLDPFSLSTNAFAPSIPLPTALSTFIVPRRGSANFFDLLEKVDLWKRLDDLGVLSSQGVVNGVRVLGVPT